MNNFTTVKYYNKMIEKYVKICYYVHKYVLLCSCVQLLQSVI